MFLYVFIALSFICSCDAFISVLNLDEINAVHYNINILSVPVLKDQVSEAETIKLMSIHGQEYVCGVPIVEINAADLKKIEDVSEDPIDMAELLVPMEAAPCLVKKIHWWTYEFCYGSMIKQYHVEDHKVLGPIMILGRFDAEYNWKNGTQSKNKLQRFHTQLYVNGTRCDITGKQRQTEVRFHCDDGVSDYIRHVDEPQSCRYLVVIGTSRVCHHPYLQPQLTKIPYKINCSPTVTDEQLQKYNEVQAALKSQMETEDPPIASLKDKLIGLLGMDDAAPLHTNRPDYIKPNFRKVLETIKEEMETYRSELMKEYSMKEEKEESNEESSFFLGKMYTVQKRFADLSRAKTEEEKIEIYEDMKKLLVEGLDDLLNIITESYPEYDRHRQEMVHRVTEIKMMIKEFKVVDEEVRQEKFYQIMRAITDAVSTSEVHSEKVQEKLESLEMIKLSHYTTGVNNPTLSEKSIDSLLLDEAETRGESVPSSEQREIEKAKLEKRKIQLIKEEKMVESRKNRLEQRLKDRLKKSGLEGQKIEVQIISTYMTDDEYPSLVALSPRDEEILIRIVNSNEEEIFEKRRYGLMLENYNFKLETALSLEEPSAEKDISEVQSNTSDTGNSFESPDGSENSLQPGDSEEPKTNAIELTVDDSESHLGTDDSESQSKTDNVDDRLPIADKFAGAGR